MIAATNPSSDTNRSGSFENDMMAWTAPDVRPLNEYLVVPGEPGRALDVDRGLVEADERTQAREVPAVLGHGIDRVDHRAGHQAERPGVDGQLDVDDPGGDAVVRRRRRPAGRGPSLRSCRTAYATSAPCSHAWMSSGSASGESWRSASITITASPQASCRPA